MLPDRESADDSARPKPDAGGFASRVAAPGEESSRPAWKAQSDLPGASKPRAFDSTGVPPTASLKPPTSDEEAPFGHLGRYRLEKKIGRGGMGTVWLGFDPRLGRPVAIKVLRGDFRHEPGAVEEFQEEGRCLARLSHPDILPVYDCGVDSGVCYLVSEYVPGGTLAEQLRREPLSCTEAAALVAHVAEAAHFAHLRGIVHRDIKPGNILMRSKDRPLLADFGLAIAEEAQLRSTPGTLGTYAYMSPEQLRGDSQFVDGRADIYSLGVILYELLTGRLPFLADSVEEYQELVLKRDARPPRSIREDIPPALEAICLKCLAREPANRYTTASDLAVALRGPLPRAASHRRWLLAGSGALLLLIAAFGIVLGLNHKAAPGNFAAPQAAPAVPPPEPMRITPSEGELAVAELPLADKAEATWGIKEDGDSLWAISDRLLLLRIGQDDGSEVKFSVRLEQQIWSGRLGVFWGYRADPQQPELQQLEYLQLFPRNAQELRLRMATLSFPRGAPQLSRDVEVGYRDLEPSNARYHRIGFTLRGGALAGLEWDSLDLSDLVLKSPLGKSAPTSAGAPGGMFGLINSGTHGTFSRPLLHGRAVRFLRVSSEPFVLSPANR